MWNIYTDPQSGDKIKILVWNASKTFGEYYSAFTVAELGEMLHHVDLIIDTISTNVGGEPHQ